MSFNSIIWLATTVSPLYVFHSSNLQQKLSQYRASALATGAKALNMLKRLGPWSQYQFPDVNTAVNIVLFADTNHSQDASQLCFLIGVLHREIKNGSVFHILAWASHKSHRPVFSTPATRILVVSGALDELMLLCKVMETIFEIKIKYWFYLVVKTSATHSRLNVIR